jgi:hypothetical protein
MTDLTDPERYAQRKQAKRLAAAIRKRGRCSACIHRDRTLGKFHCRNKEDRNGDNCGNTSGPRFKFDDTVLNELAMRDRGTHGRR